MGWWKTGGGTVVGDEPLDILSDALRGIVEGYREFKGAGPTKAEWEALLALSLPSYLGSGAERVNVVISDEAGGSKESAN